MQKHLSLIAILLALTVLTNVRAQEPANTWLTDFEAAKKTAAEKKLPILADFSGSDWCGWCIKLDKEVFSQKEFKEFAKDNLILFLADFPRKKQQSDKIKKQNDGLSKKYAIEGFPTVLLMDAEGKVFARTGYERGGAAAYVAHLKKILTEQTKK
ncbi:MAG: thioredoxin family protein [Kiritimatiellia bacterium]|nr:thioredoxin family protein [Kiritimatiellia bacterium]